MKKSIREIIERIQSLYSKGVRSDDSRLSTRHIYSKISTVKARLIVLQSDKKKKAHDWNYTILPCVEMIKVPSNECTCFLDLGCPVYRSKYKLPKILANANNYLIDFVITTDNQKIVYPTTRKESLVKKGNRYTNFDLRYVFENGYLYILSSSSPAALKIKAIFEDQVEALSFPSLCSSNGDCKDCDCKDPLDEVLAIDPDLIETLIEMSVTELLEWFTKGREDKYNNTSEDI